MLQQKSSTLDADIERAVFASDYFLQKPHTGQAVFTQLIEGFIHLGHCRVTRTSASVGRALLAPASLWAAWCSHDFSFRLAETKNAPKGPSVDFRYSTPARPLVLETSQAAPATQGQWASVRRAAAPLWSERTTRPATPPLAASG